LRARLVAIAPVVAQGPRVPAVRGGAGEGEDLHAFVARPADDAAARAGVDARVRIGLLAAEGPGSAVHAGAASSADEPRERRHEPEQLLHESSSSERRSLLHAEPAYPALDGVDIVRHPA